MDKRIRLKTHKNFEIPLLDKDGFNKKRKKCKLKVI